MRVPRISFYFCFVLIALLPGQNQSAPENHALDLETLRQHYFRAKELAEQEALEGHSSQALAHYMQALSLAEKLQLIAKLPDLHNSAGILLAMLSDHGRAYEHFNQAIRLTERSYGQNHSSIADYLNNSAESLRKMGRFSEAIQHYERARLILINRHGSRHLAIAVLDNNMGWLVLKNNPARALTLFQKAGGIIEKSAVNASLLALNLSGQCEANLLMGDLVKAHEICKKALDSLDLNARNSLEQQGGLRVLIGQIEARQGQKEKAVHNFETGLKLLEAHGGPVAGIVGQRRAGEAMQALGDKAAAARYFNRAVESILKNRLLIGRERVAFTHSLADIFNQLIALQVSSGDIPSAFKTDAIKKGLSISESLALDDALLAGGVPEARATVFAELERSIRQKIARRAVLQSQNKQELADQIQQEIWQLDRKREQFHQDLQARYPEYASRLNPAIPEIEELQKRLAAGELLISYIFNEAMPPAALVVPAKGRAGLVWLGQSIQDFRRIESKIKNLHLLFSASASDPARLCPCRIIRAENGTEHYIDDARDNAGVIAQGGKVILKNSEGILFSGKVALEFEDSEIPELRNSLQKALYSDLLAPIFKKYPETRSLIVIPDGAIYYAPVSLLKDLKGAMLIEKISIRQAHSTIAWHSLAKRSYSPARLPFFGAGNAIYSPSGPGSFSEQLSLNFTNMPETGVELKEIASLAYGPAGGSEHLLLGIDANKEQLLAWNRNGKLRRYRFLHFSVHGVLVDGKPDLNALLLGSPSVIRSQHKAAYSAYLKSGKPELQSEDGYLTYGEIKGFQLESDLAVLSACNTSLGDMRGGEGMVALPQAFLIAGSKAVLASQWAVPVRATSDLMVELYRFMIKDGLGAPGALQRAQQVMKKKYPDPYYWGAYVLYGE